MRCIALIGDLISSKRQPSGLRKQTQRRLQASFAGLNASAEVLGLLSGFTITLGDEFQALFADADRLWQCIFTIERDLYPQPIRFAMGIGEITTDIRTDAALGMDGPAFHYAREGIEHLKRSGERYRVEGMPDAGRYLHDCLALISHQRRTWKNYRLETLVDLLKGIPVADTAERIGVTPQAVYRNVRDGALEPIARLLATISSDMNEQLARAPVRS